MTKTARDSISHIVWQALTQEASHIINCTEHQTSCEDFTIKVHADALKELEAIRELEANFKPKPTDKEIQDILVAYKRRDAFATGNSGTTLKRATEMVRELYE